MEELLNKLIEKGWKPFGEDKIKEINHVKHHGTLCWYLWGGSYQRWKPIRELVSKESGLWQFVCENGMVKERNTRRENHNINSGAFMIFRKRDYQYRLIEIALTDEDKLEQFLLDNIKIDE